MKSSRVGVLLCVLAGGGVMTALTMAGCSGDDTVVPDAGPDVTADNFVPDVGVDTGTPDVTDGGFKDVTEAGLTYAEFANAQIKAMCVRWSQCCFGSDAGKFDQTLCESDNKDFGWEGNLQDLSSSLAQSGDAGQKFYIDPVLATQCINLLSAFKCPTIPSADDTAIFAACFGAAKGIVAPGAKCNFSAECTPGNYCRPGDAGTSVCGPVEPQGTNCTAGSANQACQYRGYLGTAARCDRKLPDGGPGSNTCQARLPLNTKCDFNWECASGTCDIVQNVCSSSQLTIFPGFCDSYVKDGG